MDEDGGAVDDRVFVVASREAAPLLGVAEAAFDDVAVLVVVGIEPDGPAAAWAATFPVALLVAGGFGGDHGLDAATAQVRADRAGRVCLVAADRVRPSTRPTDRTGHAQLPEKWDQHRRIPPGLPGRDHGDQRQSVPVDQLVDLRRQPAARAPDPVITRLDGQIRVIRPSPPVSRVVFVAC